MAHSIDLSKTKPNLGRMGHLGGRCAGEEAMVQNEANSPGGIAEGIVERKPTDGENEARCSAVSGKVYVSRSRR